MRRLQQIDSLSLLRGVLSTIQAETVNTTESITKGATGSRDPYGDLATMDGEFEPLPPETVFFRGEGGGLHAFDPDMVPEPVRKTATQVSRKEVEGR